MYIYKSREKGSVDISSLINEIRKIKAPEKNIATNDNFNNSIRFLNSSKHL